MIPTTTNRDLADDKWIYCVSLVLRRCSVSKVFTTEQDANMKCVYELEEDESACQVGSFDFQSPFFFTCSNDGRSQKRIMKVSQKLKQFNRKLQELKWSNQVDQGATIGIALISRRNIMHGMRETLSLLYNDFCSIKSSDQKGVNDNMNSGAYVCQPLVDILGVFTHSSGVEGSSLSCLLEPYQNFVTSRWSHDSLSDQSEEFLKSSGIQLLQALPPIPLALAFVTLLLEQKVSDNQSYLTLRSDATSLH